MLNHELMREEGILIVTPEGRLETDEFEKLGREVDPYIEERGSLNGLMIYVRSFPGWNDFAALLSHIQFVRNHHQKIRKVAAVTDSGFLSILPRVASHFVRAEVRHFDYGDREAALDWLKTGNS
ncbi:MAG: STAS/SEC14 domain-containing protein [Syntrophobacterales bacterium]|nr:MAG: STAS/SEC14 domain-containing protein [Syntrophobacterales bacterium]